MEERRTDCGREDGLITITGLSKAYLARPVIRNLSVSFPAGRVIGLMGERGVGKTTLLRMIAGLLAPDRGGIWIGGDPAGSGRAFQKVSWLLLPENLYPFFRASDAIRYYQDFFPDFDAERARRLCGEFGIGERARIAFLSKGQQERVCLFLALSRRVPLYLMDEPADGFAPEFKRDLVRSLPEQAEEGVAVLIAAHQPRDLEKLFDTAAVLTRDGIRMEDAVAIRAGGRSIEEFYREAAG